MRYTHRKYLKALESLVYLANKDNRNYWILKAIYFADKEHLSKYGTQIFDDSYRAMKQGPVPSLAYDIVKYIRGDGWFVFENPDPSTALRVPDIYTIKPLRKPNLDLLSKSDIECLDNGIEKIKNLNFGQLKDLSHDSAYLSVEQDEEMSLDNIISTLENGKEVRNYLDSI